MTAHAEKLPLTPLLVTSASLALFVMVVGAITTSAAIWAGLNPARLPLAQSTVLAIAHQYAGSLLFLLLLACTWAASKSSSGAIRWLILTALAAGIGEIVTISLGTLQDTSYIAVLHAICGHTILACLTAAAIIARTAASDDEPAVTISGSFPLATLANWIPPFVMTQVAMGALYRHDRWSVMPHMAGAMLVAFLLVSEGVVLLQRVPEHRLLRRAALWSITLVLCQISLGIADFLVRLLDFQDSVVWLVLSIAHVMVGALTFTASLCLAFSVRVYARARN